MSRKACFFESQLKGFFPMASKRVQRWSCAAFLLLTALATGLFAGVGGSISGTVLDQSGAVVPKAMVTVRSAESGIEQSVGTDSQGFYSFPSLPIGRYDMEIAVPGFRPYRRSGIIIDANSALSITCSFS